MVKGEQQRLGENSEMSEHMHWPTPVSRLHQIAGIPSSPHPLIPRHFNPVPDAEAHTLQVTTHALHSQRLLTFPTQCAFRGASLLFRLPAVAPLQRPRLVAARGRGARYTGAP